MPYYIAADGGGSKLQTLLFDENLQLLRSARAGGVNVNSTPVEVVEQNICKCFSELLLQAGAAIETVYGCFSGGAPALEKIAASFRIGKTIRLSEGRLGLYAALITEGGLVALAGTGATMYYIDKEKYHVGGGYGSVAHDEGGGYHIGRLALKAIIATDEGYGPQTSLLALFCEARRNESVRQAVLSLYESENSPIIEVASLTRLVFDAADEGDEVAMMILRDAGRSLGLQITALGRKYDAPASLPIVLSGGIFRRESVLKEEFLRIVASSGQSREIIEPLFEPVVGGVISHALACGTKIDDKLISRLQQEYAAYTC